MRIKVFQTCDRAVAAPHMIPRYQIMACAATVTCLSSRPTSLGSAITRPPPEAEPGRGGGSCALESRALATEHTSQLCRPAPPLASGASLSPPAWVLEQPRPRALGADWLWTAGGQPESAHTLFPQPMSAPTSLSGAAQRAGSPSISHIVAPTPVLESQDTTGYAELSGLGDPRAGASRQ